MNCTTDGLDPHEAVSKVVEYMREHDMVAMLLDDENTIPSYARVDEMFEDEDLDHAVAWLPRAVIENSTPGGGWNPHVRLMKLGEWLAAGSRKDGADRANMASARQHLDAAIRHLNRATKNAQPGDPRLALTTELFEIHQKLGAN